MHCQVTLGLDLSGVTLSCWDSRHDCVQYSVPGGGTHTTPGHPSGTKSKSQTGQHCPLTPHTLLGLVHVDLSVYCELLCSSKDLPRNYVLCMEHASSSAAMNHLTCSFIHIHMVWHGLKYYTVLLMCCACKCVHLISICPV